MRLENLTNGNFDETIKQGIILIDFFATWCGPCRMLSPIMEELAKDMENKVKIAKLDIEAQEDIASKYQVTSVPTLILFKDGKEFDRLVGLRDIEDIKKFISKAL